MSDRSRWTIEVPPPRVEPTPRWIRVRAGNTMVGNSQRAKLLAWYGPGTLPTYCLPPEDVVNDVLTPSPQNGGGVGFTVDHDINVDGRVIPRAARLFRGPPTALQAVDGYWTFSWDGGVSWFEEALEIHVHARDPYKRVDAVPSDRHVRVEIDGEVIAESGRAHAVFETTLPTRWYLPAKDVRQDLLVSSNALSRCPYKGTAHYFSVRLGDFLHEDIAWTYPDPVVECPRIAGLIAFFNERVDLEIDGVRLDRPRTPWSR